MHRILVVEDEGHIAAGLKLNLELEGFEVVIAGSGTEAGLALINEGPFALVVLDVMLPDTDGFAVCRKLRESGNYVPVLMLTARNRRDERVRGLDAGADDYLGKPFEISELLARIRSLLRRQDWGGAREELARSVTIGLGTVDFATETVEFGGDREQQLTHLEFELVRYFVDHPGRVISREELLEKVWNLRDYPNTRTVDNFISRLRKLFEDDPKRPRHFLSQRGSGYRFVP